ncbi:MAG: SDR family oxidoreductase [Pseudomonadales bacterium]
MTKLLNIRCLYALCLASLLSLSLPAFSANPEPTSAAAAQGEILVVGASGRSGVYIIKALEQQARAFRPMTSNIERAKGKVPGDYNWVQADVRDMATLQAAMDGVTYVISVLGATKFEGPDGPEFVDWQGTRNIVDAAKKAGVKHIVIVSAAGVSQPNNAMNKYGNVMVWKFKGENYLRAGGIPYTIIRPGGLESEDSTGKGIAMMQGDTLPNHGGFSRADLASMLLAAVGNPDAYQKTFEPIYEDEAAADAWRTEFGALLTDEQLKASAGNE